MEIAFALVLLFTNARGQVYSVEVQQPYDEQEACFAAGDNFRKNLVGTEYRLTYTCGRVQIKDDEMHPVGPPDPDMPPDLDMPL